MSWIIMVLGILQWLVPLLEWLAKLRQSGGSLNPRQTVRLNHLLAKCRELEGHAVALGCAPGGYIDPDEA